MKPVVTRFALALLVVAVALPAIGQVTDSDVDRARREMDQAMADAQELGDRVQEAWARQQELDHELTQLEEAIGRTAMLLADAEERFTEVSVEMYMSAASGTAVSMMLNVDTGTYQAGLEYLRTVNGSGRELINELSILGTELDRLTERKTEASAEQTELTTQLESMSGELLAKVEKAQGNYDRLVAEKARQDEEERQRRVEEARLLAEAAATSTTTPPAATTTQPTATTTAPSTPTTGGGPTTPTTAPPPPPSAPLPTGGVCPVAGPVSFSDTWGARRSGGRSHQGVDMIAARGTPIVAIYSGRIHRITTGSLSGLAVWLRADNGDQFFYAHLDGYGDISTGQQVEAGYVIGFNGTTGNAPDYLPHLHFEWHPRGGAAINPYPLVKSLC